MNICLYLGNRTRHMQTQIVKRLPWNAILSNRNDISSRVISEDLLGLLKIISEVETLSVPLHRVPYNDIWRGHRRRSSVNFGGGARHFCQKIHVYVWKINIMPEFYMLFALKIFFLNLAVRRPLPSSPTPMGVARFQVARINIIITICVIDLLN